MIEKESEEKEIRRKTEEGRGRIRKGRRGNRRWREAGREEGGKGVGGRWEGGGKKVEREWEEGGKD